MAAWVHSERGASRSGSDQCQTFSVLPRSKVTLHPTDTMLSTFLACFDCWGGFAVCVFWPQTASGLVP